MVWLFTIGGALLGAVLGKSFATFLAFGFIGWVVGMIVKALRTPLVPSAAAPHPGFLPSQERPIRPGSLPSQGLSLPQE